MKIAILGGGGYIGSKLCLELTKMGHTVTCIVRNINQLNAFILENCDVVTHDIDANSSNINLLRYFNNPDVVIDAAWSNLDNYSSDVHLQKTLISHYLNIKNLISNGLKSLTILGTCWEYGMKEGVLDEESKTSPIVNYAIAKDLYRKKVFKLRNSKDFNLNWARLFYIYGEDQPSNTIFSQLLNSNNGEFNMSCGDRIRDYLHIEKVVLYLSRIAISQNEIGLINVCSGKSIELKDIVNDWIKSYNLNVKVNLCYYDYSDYEPFSFWGNNSKLIKYNIDVQ